MGASGRIDVVLVSDEPILNLRGGNHALIETPKPPVPVAGNNAVRPVTHRTWQDSQNTKSFPATAQMIH